MMVGLFFFIRASTKDRTETLTLQRSDPSGTLLQELTQYFEGRAYIAQTVDSGNHQIHLRGMVRPSVFLALFLTTLAAIGMLCLALVLASLFPAPGLSFVGLTVLAPTAGWYYWRRAQREEQIIIQVESAADAANAVQSRAIITAHRDELIALQQVLKP
jgi:hypothetical protein